MKSADGNNAGLLLELDAILAVTLGGTALTGGRFSLVGSVIGALIIQTLTYAIYSLGVPPEINLVVKAVVVFAVMLLQSAEFRAAVRALGRRRPRGRWRGGARMAAAAGDAPSQPWRFNPSTCRCGTIAAVRADGDAAARCSTPASSRAQVFLNLLIDNAFLLVVAVGMTFVILSGGIDLSVGSVIALTTMVSASLVEHHHWSAGAGDPAGAGDGHGVRRAAWAC